MTPAPRNHVVPRRALLKTAAAGTALGFLAGRGWGAPAEPARKSDSERAITALYQSLTPEQRAAVCFDWDFRVDIKYGRKPLWRPDPQGILLRTHVSNAWRITPQLIGSTFYTDEQRELILDVLRTTMAPDWIDKLKQQVRDDSGVAWGGDQALAIFGKPGHGACQCSITGFHLTVRATTETNPLAAFGGAITHGHQPSGFYEKFNHPGNFFWKQSLLANEVYKLLDAPQQRQALVKENLPSFQYLGEVDRTVIVPDTPWDCAAPRAGHSLSSQRRFVAGPERRTVRQ